MLGGGGLLAIVLLKGVDGSLRHSLQRTSSELLYVPLSERIRARAKLLIDLLAQRGGQGVASLLILLLVSLGKGEIAFALTIQVLGALWLLASVKVSRRYLDLFRTTLRAGRLDDRGDLPELDVSALKALLQALSSQKDAEVICALELLAVQSGGQLIPPVILYHPSRTVVLRALDLLAPARSHRPRRACGVPGGARQGSPRHRLPSGAARRSADRGAGDSARMPDRARRARSRRR